MTATSAACTTAVMAPMSDREDERHDRGDDRDGEPAAGAVRVDEHGEDGADERDRLHDDLGGDVQDERDEQQRAEGAPEVAVGEPPRATHRRADAGALEHDDARHERELRAEPRGEHDDAEPAEQCRDDGDDQSRRST